MTAPPEAIALRVVDARRRYGTRPALDGVSFEVASGCWVGLVGPNGAGKSTLLRALVGIEPLDAGRIEILGTEARPGTWPKLRRHLGVVPQEIALYARLTARENLAVFGRLAGVPPEDLPDRVAWALAWTGLEGRADEAVKRFSGGMRRRLNIACGVLHRPRVVLLDEPTVGVDLEARESIAEMLRALCAEGAALLQSSHQLDEIQSTCDRLLVLDAGRVVASGTIAEVADGALGRVRAVKILLDREPGGLALLPGLRVRGRLVEGTVADAAADLPRLLARLEDEGYRVRDLRVGAPRLEDVFTRLTRGAHAGCATRVGSP